MQVLDSPRHRLTFLAAQGFQVPRLHCVEQRMVYSIYYMYTLVLPCIEEGRRLLNRDGSGRRTRDIIHIRRIDMDIYTKYIM